VNICYGSQLVGVEGVEHISTVHIRDMGGALRHEPSSGVFVFIGARPRTDFLPASIAKDDKGFLMTGPDVAPLPSWREPRQPCTLETTLPGVFAAGDCRRGTTKRVAFAIGDGALAVTAIHNFLGRTQPTGTV
jgi:thioredoxin reductase (NADPH)